MRKTIQTHTRTDWLGRNLYALSVRLEPELAEWRVIKRHRLEQLEIFVDPSRDQFLAAAEQARHGDARRPFLSRSSAFASLAGEVRALCLTVAAIRAFRISLGELISGISVEHRSLADIRRIEAVLIAAVDEIAATVAAANRYGTDAIAIYVPDAETPTLRSSLWLPRRRHGA